MAIHVESAIFEYFSGEFLDKPLEKDAKKTLVYKMQFSNFVLGAIFGGRAAVNLLRGVLYTMQGIQCREPLPVCIGYSWVLRTLSSEALVSWLLFRFSLNQFPKKFLDKRLKEILIMKQSPWVADQIPLIKSWSKDSISRLILTASLAIDRFLGEPLFALAANSINQRHLQNWYQSIENKLDNPTRRIIQAACPDIFPESFSPENPIDPVVSPERKASFSSRIWNVFDQSISVFILMALAVYRPKLAGLGFLGGWAYSTILPGKSGFISRIQSFANYFFPLWLASSSGTFFSGAQLFFTFQNIYHKFHPSTHNP